MTRLLFPERGSSNRRALSREVGPLRMASMAAAEGEVAGVRIWDRLAPTGLLQSANDARRPDLGGGDVHGGAELVVRLPRRQASTRTAVRAPADVPACQGLLGARPVALHHHD